MVSVYFVTDVELGKQCESRLHNSDLPKIEAIRYD